MAEVAGVVAAFAVAVAGVAAGMEVGVVGTAVAGATIGGFPARSRLVRRL